MEACLSFFGRQPAQDRQQGSLDDDEEPLIYHDDARRESQIRNAKINKGGGRGIDFHASTSQNQGEDTPTSSPSTPAAAFTILGKFVDIVAALKAGKLPSQQQTSRLLQVALKSDFLQHRDSGNALDDNYLYGFGPTSKRGAKTLISLASMLQAALEFGMEKNGAP